MLKKSEYKRQTEKLVKMPLSIKDTIPINRISKDGIFELENKKGPHLFDKVYVFSDINFTTLDEDEKEDICKKYEILLHSINTSYKIIISNHYADNNKMKEDILHRAINDEVLPLANEFNNMISERLEQGRSGLKQSKYFVISTRKEDFNSARTYFNTIEFSLKSLFNKLGSGLIPLNATERLRALHSFYRMGEEETFSFDWNEYFKLKRDWRNDIINTRIREKDNYIELEHDKCAVALFVRKFPNSITDHFLTEITNLDFPLIYTIDCDPIDDDYAYQKVMDIYMSNERSINKEQEYKNENGNFSTSISYEKRKRQESIEEILDRMNEFDEKLLYVGMTILIRGKSFEELTDRAEKIKNIGNQMHMDITEHTARQMDALLTTLPLGVRFVDTLRTMTSDELSIFLPFNVQEILDKQGYCYGFNTVSKNVIIVNRKYLNNPNGLVFGIPGSGKSFYIKMEMGQVFSFSSDEILVVDPMGEYKDIATSWNGHYINLTQSEENRYYLNPFHVPEKIEDMDKFIAEKAEFSFAILEQALKPEACTSRHTAIMDRAVRAVYVKYFRDLKKITGKIKPPSSPTIKSIRDYIMENEDMVKNDMARDIVDQLEAFAEGTMSIFSKDQSIEENNRFTVYGFPELGNRLRPMAMLIMIETITSRIKYNQSKGVATWVYLDEIHELLGDEYSLKAVERLWREVRKRGGVCTGMTQNIIDVGQRKETKTMVSNSEFLLLLKQGDEDKDTVSELLNLSNDQINTLGNATPGTGLIKCGDKIVPFDNTVDKDSNLYNLFNTNFHEIYEGKF